MSIASKLTKLETDISNAYDVINTKGGTIPSNKNTENLSTAINSISSGGGITPTGTINITTNGTHDVTTYANANVQVPSGSQNSKTFTYTLTEDSKIKTYFNDADSDILAHRTDTNFGVSVVALFEYSTGLSFRGGFNSGHSLIGASTYGAFLRTNSSGGTNYSPISKTITTSSTDIGVDSTGRVFVYGTTTIVLRAGTYKVTVSW